jgi:hypothetical protein
MKRALLLIATAILAMAWTASAYAQAIPLLVSVKKNENTESTTHNSTSYYGYTYSSKSGVQTLSYTVDIMNASTGTVSALQIRWSVVLREPGGGKLRLVEGKKNTDLARGQKYTFTTDVIELGQFYQSSWGGSSRSGNAEVLGYLVEAVVDGNVAASTAQPMNIRGKVNEAREAANQKRHRF